MFGVVVLDRVQGTGTHTLHRPNMMNTNRLQYGRFPPSPKDSPVKRNQFRTVFISDAHLGSRGCKAEVLSAFLKSIDTERCTVGDIVDFWRLESRSYWPAAHNEVVRHILKLVKRAPGWSLCWATRRSGSFVRGDGLWWNRDQMQDVHRCLDGRRLLITHGDQYDLVVRHSRLLSKIGSSAYEMLLRLNGAYNRYRRWQWQATGRWPST